MDALRTAVSYLGTMEIAWGGEPELADRDRALDLFAKIPTMIATDYRFRTGGVRIAPREDLPMVENFFNMCFGEVPPPEVIKAFDTSMILYAEHSFNASTFTVRTIASSRSDIFSAVTGGIGSLKGPLHGGANEAVMKMFLEIGDPRYRRAMDARGHRPEEAGDGLRPPGLQIGRFPACRPCAAASRISPPGRATIPGSACPTRCRR